MNKIAIIYWSGTGNTELMAQAIKKGIEQSGAAAELFTPDTFKQETLNDYTAFAFGCPSMGCETLEESEFEPFFTSLEADLTGKQVLLFGSYGWGDGEWMRNWQQRVVDNGASLFEEGLIINGTPDDEGLAKCQTYGTSFAKSLK